MTDDQKKLWMERFAGMVEQEPEAKKAWIAEYDALTPEDRAIIEAEREKIEDRANEIVNRLHAICDTGAQTVIRDFDPEAETIDLEAATFALLYRIVNGWNNSISILPPILYEIAEASKQNLASEIKNGEVLAGIDHKLSVLIDQMTEGNKLNQRIVNGLGALYKLQKGDTII